MGCYPGKTRVPSLFKRLLRTSDGATVIEYGLLIGLMSVVIIVGIQTFSNQLINMWQIVTFYSENSLSAHG